MLASKAGERGKGIGEPVGEILNTGSFSLVVSGDDQSETELLSFKGTMKSRFARKQHIGLILMSLGNEIVTGAAADGDSLDRARGVAHELSCGAVEDVCDQPGKLG